MKQIKRIDDVECPYCRNIENGTRACNGDMDCSIVVCSKCEREYEVGISCEFTCTEIEDN